MTQQHQNQVNQQFDTKANSYLTSTVHANGEDLVALRSLLANNMTLPTHAIALDVGCGPGHVAFNIATFFKEVIAYDLSENMLALVADEARSRNLPQIKTKQGNIENLSVANHSIDLITSRYSAHHWTNATLGLTNIFNALKPNGYAILMDIVAPDNALLCTWLQSIELLRDTSHVKNMEMNEWQTKLKAAEFLIEHTQSFKVRLEFDTWVARSQTAEILIKAIKHLFDSAPNEVCDYFQIENDYSFTVDSQLIVARKQS